MPEQQVMERTTPAAVERTRTGRTYSPNVDIIERPDRLQVLADMPGVDADSIDVKFENGTLTIFGRVPPRQRPSGRMLLREYGIGDFYRTFQVSEMIDASGITAEYRDGVLTLQLPKVEAARPRRITVQTREGSDQPRQQGRRAATGNTA